MCRTIYSVPYYIVPISFVYRLNADITVLREKVVESENSSYSRKVAEILVRKVPESQQVRT